MNGFLVQACYFGHDIPIGLFADREAAVTFAKDVPWSLEGVVPAETQLLPESEESTACFIAIYEFRSGRLVGWETVRDYDAECIDEVSGVTQPQRASYLCVLDESFTKQERVGVGEAPKKRKRGG